MQRITGLAARIPRLASSAAGVQTGDSGLICCKQPAVGLLHRWQQWASLCAVSGRPLSAEPGQRGSRRRFIAGERCRLFSSQAGAEEPPGNPGSQPHISVVGIPDPLTWIRCKFITFLVDLYFEVDINSGEFQRGVMQALVHVSSKMSRGRYHELKGVLTDETMREYVEEKCKLLTKAQRRQLAVNMEDIIFVLLEDISVVFDKHGRKFCFVAIRFWLLSSHEGPDDPEGTKIFKVASSEDGSPQKKLATAVYEFHGELKTGTSPDWMVTTVWHWHWKVAA